MKRPKTFWGHGISLSYPNQGDFFQGQCWLSTEQPSPRRLGADSTTPSQ